MLLFFCEGEFSIFLAERVFASKVTEMGAKVAYQNSRPREKILRGHVANFFVMDFFMLLTLIFFHCTKPFLKFHVVPIGFENKRWKFIGNNVL